MKDLPTFGYFLKLTVVPLSLFALNERAFVASFPNFPTLLENFWVSACGSWDVSNDTIISSSVVLTAAASCNGTFIDRFWKRWRLYTYSSVGEGMLHLFSMFRSDRWESENGTPGRSHEDGPRFVRTSCSCYETENTGVNSPKLWANVCTRLIIVFIFGSITCYLCTSLQLCVNVKFFSKIWSIEY